MTGDELISAVVMNYDDVTASARQLARELADDARRLAGPVIWVTGNQYMPPMRSFPAAEEVWQTDDPDLWELFVETVESELSNASVLMESPEYDNALYVVDLSRWECGETPNPDFDADDINSEWIPRETISGQ